MNNLYRELAPISTPAWSEIEEEVTRSFSSTVAGRRVVDVIEAGSTVSAIGTGRVSPLDPPVAGLRARRREAVPVVELRVEFELDRDEIDAVERGGRDSDWRPATEAAITLALAEDRAIVEGYPAGGITGLRPARHAQIIELPSAVTGYPEAVARGLSRLRADGVGGPYALLLGDEDFIGVSDTTEHGFLVIEHLRRIVDGDVLRAPALAAPILVTTRGGDFALHLVQDVSIGYLSHTATSVRLYLEEAFTFLDLTAEAAIALAPKA